MANDAPERFQIRSLRAESKPGPAPLSARWLRHRSGKRRRTCDDSRNNAMKRQTTNDRLSLVVFYFLKLWMNQYRTFAL